MEFRFTKALRVLAASSLLAIVVLEPGACSRKGEKIAPAGAEDWVVDGFPYHVVGSHYERAGKDAVYVITYPAPAGTSAANLDKDGAAVLVWPLIKYAYNNRTFERAKVPGAEKVRLAVDIVGHGGGPVLFRYENPPLQDQAKR